MKQTPLRKLTGVLLCAIMLFTLNAQALPPAVPAAAAEPAGITVPARPALTSDKVFYMAFTGADANDGLTKTTPKKTLGAPAGSGLASLLSGGGKVVAVGKAYVGANYTLSAFDGNTVLFTAKDTDGTSYLGDAANQLGNILGHTVNAHTFTMTGNVIFENIGLLNRATAGDCFTFRVADGARVVVGDGVVFQNVEGGYAVPKLVVDEGGVVFLDVLGFSRYLGEGTIVLKNSLVSQVTAETFAEFEGVVCDEDGNELFLPQAFLDSASLYLLDSIGVNFYTVLTDAVTSDAGAYALFTGPNGEKQIPVSEAPVKNGRHVFTYDVYAKQTREDITIRFFDGSGGQIGLFLNDAGHTALGTEGYSYSVEDYLTAIGASGEGEEIKALAAALADYGAAADRLFCYSAEPPAIAEDLSAITAERLSAYRLEQSGTAPAGFALTGATLLLEEKTTMRVYFTCPDPSVFSVTVDGEAAAVGSKDGQYYAEIPGIAAKELGTPHTVCFGDYRAVCSALTYAYSVLMAYPETDLSQKAQDMRALARTLARYGDTAERYFSVARGDEAAVVFVTETGAGRKDGSSPENAATLADGLGKTKRTGGTVVVCGPLTFEKDYTFPSAEAPVTLTSVWDSVDYRTAAGASLTFSANAFFDGDYDLDGLRVVAGASNLLFCFGYHNVTVGADVDCVRASGVTTDIALICGCFAGNSSAYTYVYQTSCRADAAVTVRGGTWQYIRGGNFRPKPASVFGTVDGGVTFEVFVEGGRFTADSGSNFNSVSGMNGVAGTVYMEISGGTFEGPVYLFSRTGTNTNNYPVPVTGSVTLKITGGVFRSAALAVCQPTANQKIDLTDAQETILCVAGGTFPSGTAAVGESGSRLILGSSVPVTKGSGFTTANCQKDDAACAAVQAPALTDNRIRYTDPPAVSLSATEPLTAAEQSALGEEAKANLAKVNTLLAAGNLAAKQNASRMTLTDPAYALDRVQSVRLLSLLTGEYSDNRTLSNYDIARIGGGYMIDCGGTTLLAFGDTKPEDDLGTPWRANALAFTTDCDYTDGITFDGFYMGDTYQAEPFAGEFLLSGHDVVNKTEESKIPTGGVKIGDTLYFCYMSVASWRENEARDGRWPCNYGGLAKSTDFGRSWETPSDLRWPAGTDVSDPVEEIPDWGLAQLYPVMDGEYVYFFGVPGGRGGYCRLMRVRRTQIENFSAYEYMTGRDGNGRGIFERGETAMATNFAAVDKCVGGVGVMYNEYLGEWLMFYCAKQAGSLKNSIVLRAAKTLDGVWSEPVLVMSQATFGSVYEPRVCSAYTREGGRYMMVITSRSDIYQSLVWEVEISKKS
ncbi:MAG: DUF4185 domain-containing protein [Clostridia bacterium]|nr:DUF4185 domain-containing protein [Clostridia bacterium]